MIELPDISDAEVVFGTTKALPKWDEIPKEFKDPYNIYNRAASGLILHGGKLSDYGLKLRNDIDLDKFTSVLIAHIRSYALKLERKEAAIGLMLSWWTEPIQKE